MYFRLPLIIVFGFSCIFGFLLLHGHFEKVTTANGETIGKNATDKPVVENESFNSIQAKDLQAHLEFLADDLLEGRDTGSRGARIASMYISSHFERYGLKPLGKNGTYFQDVELNQRRILPTSRVFVEVDGEMVPLRYKKDFVVTGVPVNSGSEIVEEMVFTGFGIKADEYNYNDYSRVNAAKKISVYVTGEPFSEDDKDFFKGKERTRYSEGDLKRQAAKAAGAVGAVSILRNQHMEYFSWGMMENYLTKPQISLKTEGNNKKQVTDFASITLHPEAAELIFAGTAHNYNEIDEAATKGAVTTFELRKKIKFKINFEDEDLNDANVIGYLEGSDAKLKSEVIVITAHYDHVGIGTPVKNDSIYNGASDNASGTSGLLELVEAFSLLPVPPKRSIVFMALTAEEKGLLGSKYYVEHPVFPLKKTIACINLDMIGLGDSTGVILYGQERSSLGEDFKNAAAILDLNVLPDDLPEERVFYRSDHYSFAQKGVPAIFPGFGMKRSDYQKFREFYHQPSDDAELDWLNYNYMQKHVQMVYLAILSVTNASAAPVWAPDDEFGKIRSK